MRHGWAWHYLALLIAAAVAFSALRLSVSSRLNLALLLLSTAIAVYGAEALIGHVLFSSTRFSMADWLNFPSDRSSNAAVRRIKEERSADASFDTRTRLEVVHDLRDRGVQAFPDVFSAALFQSTAKGVIRSVFTTGQEELLPLASLANATTVFCNESGDYIIYESDEHGFHNPRGLWQSKPIQVVAVGDSFTHGACVATDDGFVSRIRSRLPATINLGINGDGPLTMLATLREYGTWLRPSIVLWFFYEGNDSRDLDEREKYSPLLRNYLDPSFSQRLIERQTEINEKLTAYLDRAMQPQETSVQLEQFLKLQHLRRSLASLVNKPPGRDGLPGELIEFLEANAAPASKEDLELFRAILDEARVNVAAWGGQLYFIYLPAWQRYRIPDLANRDRDVVLRMVKEMDIPIVDIHEAFAKHPDPLSLFPSRRHAHYNVEGHHLVAQEVLKRLDADAQSTASSNPQPLQPESHRGGRKFPLDSKSFGSSFRPFILTLKPDERKFGQSWIDFGVYDVIFSPLEPTQALESVHEAISLSQRRAIIAKKEKALADLRERRERYRRTARDTPLRHRVDALLKESILRIQEATGYLRKTVEQMERSLDILQRSCRNNELHARQRALGRVRTD